MRIRRSHSHSVCHCHLLDIRLVFTHYFLPIELVLLSSIYNLALAAVRGISSPLAWRQAEPEGTLYPASANESWMPLMIFSMSPRSGLTTVTPMWPTGCASQRGMNKIRKGLSS